MGFWIYIYTGWIRWVIFTGHFEGIFGCQCDNENNNRGNCFGDIYCSMVIFVRDFQINLEQLVSISLTDQEREMPKGLKRAKTNWPRMIIFSALAALATRPQSVLNYQTGTQNERRISATCLTVFGMLRIQ